MKTETFKAPDKKIDTNFLDALRSLKPGQAIRIKTAAEWRLAGAQITTEGRKMGVQFRTKNDGPDVLVFINPTKQRTKQV